MGFLLKNNARKGMGRKGALKKGEEKECSKRERKRRQKKGRQNSRILKSIADASNDASSTSASVGSRLAFRGKIVRAQSVAAYKAIREVA